MGFRLKPTCASFSCCMNTTDYLCCWWIWLVSVGFHMSSHSGSHVKRFTFEHPVPMVKTRIKDTEPDCMQVHKASAQT